MAKRTRLERGSLNPDDILRGAFELTDEVTVDNLSMPMLARHLGIGVTSIYWYFRKKDDLLTAMADHVLRESVRSTPSVEPSDWRGTLQNHARTVRRMFLGNPILCDLILIRPSLSANVAKLGARHNENVIAGLVESGFTLADAVGIYSSIQLHVHGMIVLQRLQDKNRMSDSPSDAYYEILPVSPETTPLLAAANENGFRGGEPNDHNFEYGLTNILDHAAQLLATTPAQKAAR
ncbi:TetR/AcrR family transcriptional regulator [Rhodococcus artemisiae]|uniref:TetR/AcrR family transcriptional regulator n=1 Tax=Rhodococcus artemisiae TaxID=714159 RepID=A0ABU7LB32_9NOCA|nr:TetR/AcrR family transcriptional regulator [Rhodococcus artemisiae]MEE2058507.1 TetR/AcrR family transcriptional regulator [Rhodococcus artemisiae]